ncbi:hypothetical protein [uncultured Draconibacterium sp.]|uniref:hypothetical protein n=1 Tax=uncultured Draconibacterium sp. TaxID=1573823 RepID=UPI0025ECEE52|nr:hypothetical protein [uncultured Draconibacterium sp.]
MEETKLIKRNKLTKQVAVRLDEPLTNAIKVEAANQGRTLAGMIRRTLSQNFGQKNQ